MARRGKKQQPIQINNVAEKMKAEGQCRLCGRLNRGSGGRELTKHRLVPGRHGGEYLVANVIPLCRRCHDDVEAEDPSARRMLRPKLWPLEVAHAIKKMEEPWFDLMYPKPAMMSLRLRQVDELTVKVREAQGNSGSAEYAKVKGKKRRQTEKLVGWDWVKAHPDQWEAWGLMATSEKAMARQRQGMRTATIKIA